MTGPWNEYTLTTKAIEAPPWQEYQKPTGIDYAGPTPEVRAAIAKLPPEQRDQALKEWADAFVANERKAGGFMQGASDTVRNLARGTPVGSWLDEANAGLAAGQHALGLGGAPYDEALAYQRATDRAIDSGSTKIGSLPIIGDVTAAGATKLAGGIASAPFAPAIRAVQGGSRAGNMINAGVTGTAYGAAYGAGEGETADQRLKSGATGAAIGAGIGTAAPVVSRALGNVASYVMDKFRPTPQLLRSYDPQAVRNVSQGAADDALFPNRYPQAVAELGREGMLADMGPNMRSQAGAIANRPGPGQRILTDNLEARRQGDPQRGMPSATDRIKADVDSGLGPAENVPVKTEALRTQANQNAQPYYDAFYKIYVDPARYPQMQPILLRAEAAGVVQEARKSLERKGFNPDEAMNTGRFWDQMKRSASSMADAAKAKNDRELATDYGNLARDIRRTVDMIITPKPYDRTQSVYYQARKLAGDGLQFEDAVQAGQKAFQKGVTPDQMGVDLAGMNQLQQEAFRVGGRDAVRTAMGNASTAFGPNADTAARKLLQSEFSKDKLAMIEKQPGGADRINRRLAAETEFADTEQQVLRNSATAKRLAAQDLYPKPDSTKDMARSFRQSSAGGLVAEGVFRIANILRSGASTAQAERTARDAALMLSAQGGVRDQLANALMQYGQNGAVTRRQKDAIERIAQNLMEGSRQQAISDGPSP